MARCSEGIGSVEGPRTEKTSPFFVYFTLTGTLSSAFYIFTFTSLTPWEPWQPEAPGHRPHWPTPLSTPKRRSKRFHRPAFPVLSCRMSRLAFYDFLSESWADLRCQGIVKTMSLYLSLLSSPGLVLCWSHAGADGGVLHCANVSPWLWFLWIWPFDVLRIGTEYQPMKNVECFIVVKLIIYLHTLPLYTQHAWV